MPENPERPRNEVWDALVLAVGWAPENRDRAGCKRFGKAVKALTEAGADATSIRVRAQQHHRQWPGLLVTPESLVKHWSQLGAAAPKPRTSAPPVREDEDPMDIAAAIGRPWAAPRG